MEESQTLNRVAVHSYMLDMIADTESCTHATQPSQGTMQVCEENRENQFMRDTSLTIDYAQQLRMEPCGPQLRFSPQSGPNNSTLDGGMMGPSREQQHIVPQQGPSYSALDGGMMGPNRQQQYIVPQQGPSNSTLDGGIMGPNRQQQHILLQQGPNNSTLDREMMGSSRHHQHILLQQGPSNSTLYGEMMGPKKQQQYFLPQHGLNNNTFSGGMMGPNRQQQHIVPPQGPSAMIDEEKLSQSQGYNVTYRMIPQNLSQQTSAVTISSSSGCQGQSNMNQQLQHIPDFQYIPSILQDGPVEMNRQSHSIDAHNPGLTHCSSNTSLVPTQQSSNRPIPLMIPSGQEMIANNCPQYCDQTGFQQAELIISQSVEGTQQVIQNLLSTPDITPPSPCLISPISSPCLISPISSPCLISPISSPCLISPISSPCLISPISSPCLISPISSPCLISPISSPWSTLDKPSPCPNLPSSFCPTSPTSSNWSTLLTPSPYPTSPSFPYLTLPSSPYPTVPTPSLYPTLPTSSPYPTLTTSSLPTPSACLTLPISSSCPIFTSSSSSTTLLMTEHLYDSHGSHNQTSHQQHNLMISQNCGQVIQVPQTTLQNLQTNQQNTLQPQLNFQINQQNTLQPQQNFQINQQNTCHLQQNFLSDQQKILNSQQNLQTNQQNPCQPHQSFQTNQQNPCQPHQNFQTNQYNTLLPQQDLQINQQNPYQPQQNLQNHQQNSWLPQQNVQTNHQLPWQPQESSKIIQQNPWQPQESSKIIQQNSWQPQENSQIFQQNLWQPQENSQIFQQNPWQPQENSQIFQQNSWQPQENSQMAEPHLMEREHTSLNYAAASTSYQPAQPHEQIGSEMLPKHLAQTVHPASSNSTELLKYLIIRSQKTAKEKKTLQIPSQLSCCLKDFMTQQFFPNQPSLVNVSYNDIQNSRKFMQFLHELSTLGQLAKSDLNTIQKNQQQHKDMITGSSSACDTSSRNLMETSQEMPIVEEQLLQQENKWDELIKSADACKHEVNNLASNLEQMANEWSEDIKKLCEQIQKISKKSKLLKIPEESARAKMAECLTEYKHLEESMDKLTVEMNNKIRFSNLVQRLSDVCGYLIDFMEKWRCLEAWKYVKLTLTPADMDVEKTYADFRAMYTTCFECFHLVESHIVELQKTFLKEGVKSDLCVVKEQLHKMKCKLLSFSWYYEKQPLTCFLLSEKRDLYIRLFGVTRSDIDEDNCKVYIFPQANYEKRCHEQYMCKESSIEFEEHKSGNAGDKKSVGMAINLELITNFKRSSKRNSSFCFEQLHRICLVIKLKEILGQEIKPDIECWSLPFAVRTGSEQLWECEGAVMWHCYFEQNLYELSPTSTPIATIDQIICMLQAIISTSDSQRLLDRHEILSLKLMLKSVSKSNSNTISLRELVREHLILQPARQGKQPSRLGDKPVKQPTGKKHTFPFFTWFMAAVNSYMFLKSCNMSGSMFFLSEALCRAHKGNAPDGSALIRASRSFIEGPCSKKPYANLTVHIYAGKHSSIIAVPIESVLKAKPEAFPVWLLQVKDEQNVPIIRTILPQNTPLKEFLDPSQGEEQINNYLTRFKELPKSTVILQQQFKEMGIYEYLDVEFPNPAESSCGKSEAKQARFENSVQQ